jgi:4-aminobutyrate aminotransferase-like enzyme/Ser/Thr protein kinase RdoA (MazF antagonist)/murein DD-endopeptidase MepM/ murein hydrolase activator NlpD
MASYEAIKISSQEAESILLDKFGIEGKANPLPGYIDFNFRIKVGEKNKYVLKVSRPDEDEAFLDYQQQLLQYINKREVQLIVPKVAKDKDGNNISSITDSHGNKRKVRLLSWVEGRLWSSVNPQTDSLRFSLGEKTAKLIRSLEGFDHPQASRDFEWDLAQAHWTAAHLDMFTQEEREIITPFQQRYEASQARYQQLRKSVVHNDANDNNVIVSEDLHAPRVTGIIDFGDAIYTQIINDLAITCAYAVMEQNNPLEAALPVIKGFHSIIPLQEEELSHLHTLIAMRLIVSITSSTIGRQKEPENEYLSLSEKPAWDLLKKWHTISPDFAEYSFREACGFTAHPDEKAFEQWAKRNLCKLSELFPGAGKEEVSLVDLSVGSLWLGGRKEIDEPEIFQFKIDQLQKEQPDAIIAGGYCEPRPLYISTAYDRKGNNGRESRTIHLGIDFWLPAGTAVHALFDGEVVTAHNDVGYKAYGGLIILKHQENGLSFYSLHGHLSMASIEDKQPGDRVKKGECIAHLGAPHENGYWAPHLHFQLMLSMLDYEIDFPGVAYNNEIGVWKSICPSPNLLFESPTLQPKAYPDNQELINYRKQHLGKSLSLQYREPIHMVRGEGVYLVDHLGNKYLDTVNNVAHVGHEHPAVVQAGQRQMALLNTNSRYLHQNINMLAEALLETLPPELSVLHFVNSGSEANELAIRMAKAATGEDDVIASEVGYHGNSNICVDISSYKFDGKGGKGAPDQTHIFPLPDTFRGKHRGEDAAEQYANEVEKLIGQLHQKGRKPAACIIEPIISCGGQIELPKGFLTEAYAAIREVGGLCISDEVQTGCGRMGKTFWGFQLHDVVPDIVTMGKPLGNGHPVAAVACTREVADKFANGMEYFNTFGGNPVSCAIAKAVLDVIKEEGLQQNALVVGEYVKEGLRTLASEFPIIGDVRGQGLFLGFELVNARKEPLGEAADYLINRMKEHKILMSSDGKDHNVLKIKPPMVFSKKDADELLFYIGKVMQEDVMQAAF